MDSRPSFVERTLVNALVGVTRPLRSEAVCMLHVGRVGSTVICDMLRRHGEIDCLGELWNREHSHIHSRTGFNDYERSPDPYFPLKRRMLRHPRRMLLFEIKFLAEHHLKMLADDIDDYVRTVTRLGVTRFIILERRNLLRRAISGQILRESGSVISRPDKEPRPRRHASISPPFRWDTSKSRSRTSSGALAMAMPRLGAPRPTGRRSISSMKTM